MKCPLCRKELDNFSSEKMKRRFRLLVIWSAIIISVLIIYFIGSQSVIDLSHDVLIPMPNNLSYSIYQDGPENTGGIVAVYGNITNPKSWDIDPLVSIRVNNGENWSNYHIHAGVLPKGESRYFSCVYHFDFINESVASVELEVWGS